MGGTTQSNKHLTIVIIMMIINVIIMILMMIMMIALIIIIIMIVIAINIMQAPGPRQALARRPTSWLEDVRTLRICMYMNIYIYIYIIYIYIYIYIYVHTICIFHMWKSAPERSETSAVGDSDLFGRESRAPKPGSLRALASRRRGSESQPDRRPSGSPVIPIVIMTITMLNVIVIILLIILTI